jgi:hypothetical protein
MTDCFIRTIDRNLEDPLRKAFLDATVARWRMEPQVTITWILNKGIREGRMWAEAHAFSDPYIVTDDDVLPHGKKWLERGLLAMANKPEFAICSSLSLIESENMAKGPEGSVIYDVAWVGAPMWIKRGVIGEDLPEMTLGSECGVIDTYAKSKGYRCGLIEGLRHLNMGHGFSTDPTQQWGF